MKQFLLLAFTLAFVNLIYGQELLTQADSGKFEGREYNLFQPTLNYKGKVLSARLYNNQIELWSVAYNGQPKLEFKHQLPEIEKGYQDTLNYGQISSSNRTNKLIELNGFIAIVPSSFNSNIPYSNGILLDSQFNLVTEKLPNFGNVVGKMADNLLYEKYSGTTEMEVWMTDHLAEDGYKWFDRKTVFPVNDSILLAGDFTSLDRVSRLGFKSTTLTVNNKPVTALYSAVFGSKYGVTFLGVVNGQTHLINADSADVKIASNKRCINLSAFFITCTVMDK